MRIFIMHYSPLIDRKLNIENLLDELEIEGEFITEFDKEVLNKSDKKLQQNILLWKKELNLIKSIMIRNIIETNRNSSIAFKLYWQYIKFFQNIITPKSFMPRELSLSEKSLTLKHHLALEKIYESKEPGLIIEDDIILKPESKQLIEDSYFLCKKNFDFIDLGGGCDLPIFKEDKKINENDRFINLKIPRSRTTAAYMISSDCAKVLSNGLLPLTMPIDWKYQFLFVKNNLKVAWSYPSAFVHGSESIFKTSIDKFSNV